MLSPREVALDFLKKEWFMAGLLPLLSEKVKGRFLANYEEAIEVAHLKDKKLCLQVGEHTTPTIRRGSQIGTIASNSPPPT